MLRRVHYSRMNWGPLLMAMLLTGIGLAFVISATADPVAEGAWGREAKMQLIWWGLSLTACGVCLHVPLATWKQLALPLFILCLLVQVGMIALAGTPLVPSIKGAHNWIALGPFRVQPSEFYKIGALLLGSSMLADPRYDVRSFGGALLVLFIICLPAVTIAKEDLGSALTFFPMAIGMLLLAGMHLRHLAVLGVLGLATMAVGVLTLIKTAPTSYQVLRLKAWLNPEEFHNTTGYQSLRAFRSVGSGQLTGKGYGQGDQNLLGWLPEKHTDMIFAVIGEETGFLGCLVVLGCILTFGLTGLWAAMVCRDSFGRFIIAGFTCLIMGQVAINLAVVLGLMPVTGITLPFFSYGGSSLLGTYITLGICGAASVARSHQLGRHSSGVL